MSMTVPGLKAKIISEIVAEFGTAEDAAILDKYAQATAKAVVEYIQANATVIVPGVSTGGSTVTGTIT